MPRGARPAHTCAVPSHARTWPAAVALFFLAGLIPETVATFNSPPLLLVTRPAVFLFISAFYGSVGLLVREYIRRRQVRWASVLLLGAAAGSVNEGIIAGTWYKVQYPGYAMIGGFDPAVAVGLTVFHMLVSTVLPIFLVEIIFPDVAARRWLRPRSVTAVLLLLTATAAVGFGSAAGHRELKIAVLAGVVVAVIVALALPGSGNRSADLRRFARPVPAAARLRLAGAAAAVTFYVLLAVVPGLIGAAVRQADLARWQVVLVLLMAGFCGVVLRVGRDWTGRAGWSQPQSLAVITGALLPTIIASLVLPAALRTLEPLATLPMLALLIWLSRRQRWPAGSAARSGKSRVV